ncbi:peroxiredoxin [Sphingomonas beigongshangi]|uniref:peroxiredoxin n=1 Tax=Sphingomonas beigongshangi TaxID=2782540 RepID=UPI001AEDE4D6|nr:peroxiredoxin [Sphingomonas beigongshangi]
MDDGATIPAVSVTGMDGSPIRLTDLPLPAVIYFYPKDDTAGCTREAQDFSVLSADFAAAGATVVGISKDPPSAHAKFAAKHALTVTLASDEDGAACEAFGVWGEKQMYGRTYMGIERATFLFGRDGRLVRAWRKVKVPGHAQAVLDAVRAL